MPPLTFSDVVKSASGYRTSGSSTPMSGSHSNGAPFVEAPVIPVLEASVIVVPLVAKSICEAKFFLKLD